MANPGACSITRIESLEAWVKALQVVREFGICGLGIETSGQDPLISRIRLVQLALPLPNGGVYIADTLVLGKTPLDDLAALTEDAHVKKVVHNAKHVLSFIQASQGRRLKFRNIFDSTFTALGRRRVWPRFGVGAKATKFQAYNTPSQGTGADLIMMVMCELYDRLTDEVDEDVRIIASIHDELILEVPEDQAEAYAKMLSEIMNRIGSELLYPVPVTSEAQILSS